MSSAEVSSIYTDISVIGSDAHWCGGREPAGLDDSDDVRQHHHLQCQHLLLLAGSSLEPDRLLPNHLDAAQRDYALAISALPLDCQSEDLTKARRQGRIIGEVPREIEGSDNFVDTYCIVLKSRVLN
jgi:hypothetical protein